MMNRYHFSLLCAAALIASDVRPAFAQAVLQRCDKAMADAESAGQLVASCAQILAKTPSTPRPNVPGTAPEEFNPIPADIKREALSEPVYGRLLAFHAYSMYLTRDPNYCKPLALLQRDQACYKAVQELVTARGNVGTVEESKAACRLAAQTNNIFNAQERVEDAERALQCCNTVAESRGQSNPCAKVVPRCIPDLAVCQMFMSSINGDSAACQNIPAAATRQACVDMTTFVKAFKAKDVSQCGSSEFCRVLMGGGKQVVQGLAGSLTSPAAQWFLKNKWLKASPVREKPQAAASFPGFVCEMPLQSEPNRKATGAVLSAARVCLTDIELALPRIDLATAKGIDDRFEKLVRIGMRIESYYDGTAGKK